MPTIDPHILASAFLLGFLGSGHCLGMCGGLSSALGLNTGQSGRVLHVVGYNLGRITFYGPDTQDLSTITGFELNSEIEE